MGTALLKKARGAARAAGLALVCALSAAGGCAIACAYALGAAQGAKMARGGEDGAGEDPVEAGDVTVEDGRARAGAGQDGGERA